MAEILVKAQSANHSDPEKDARGCYKRGMPVVIKPDGHQWGAEEGLPKFVVIKVPTIGVNAVAKYVERMSNLRRKWRIRVDDMPAAARNKLANSGQLTIRAGSYAGAADYTWAQVKGYFRDQVTGLDETEDM